MNPRKRRDHLVERKDSGTVTRGKEPRLLHTGRRAENDWDTLKRAENRSGEGAAALRLERYRGDLIGAKRVKSPHERYSYLEFS